MDVDRRAINFAHRSFIRSSQVRFVCEDLRQTTLPASSFDYILLAGVLHHVDDTLARELVVAAFQLLAPSGLIIVSEPLQPVADDSWLVRQFIRVEQGAFVRSGRALVDLLQSIPEIAVQEQEEFLIAPTPLPYPKVARFGLYRLIAAPGGATPVAATRDSGA